MSLLGDILGTVTLGLVQEVEDPKADGNDESVAQAAPAVFPTVIGSSPAPRRNAPINSGSQADIATAADKKAGTYFDAVLADTDEKFKDFLSKKQEYVDLLLEGGNADKVKVDGIATAKAAAAIKITLSDINRAMQDASSSLQRLSSDFDSQLAEKRRQSIDIPTKGIKETEQKIEQIRNQIADLQKEANDLESGIKPTQAEIAEAASMLAKAQSIFASSHSIVENRLKNLEAAIIAALKK